MLSWCIPAGSSAHASAGPALPLFRAWGLARRCRFPPLGSTATDYFPNSPRFATLSSLPKTFSPGSDRLLPRGTTSLTLISGSGRSTGNCCREEVSRAGTLLNSSAQAAGWGRSKAQCWGQSEAQPGQGYPSPYSLSPAAASCPFPQRWWEPPDTPSTGVCPTAAAPQHEYHTQTALGVGLFSSVHLFWLRVTQMKRKTE